MENNDIKKDFPLLMEKKIAYLVPIGVIGILIRQSF